MRKLYVRRQYDFEDLVWLYGYFAEVSFEEIHFEMELSFQQKKEKLSENLIRSKLSNGIKKTFERTPDLIGNLVKKTER